MLLMLLEEMAEQVRMAPVLVVAAEIMVLPIVAAITVLLLAVAVAAVLILDYSQQNILAVVR